MTNGTISTTAAFLNPPKNENSKYGLRLMGPLIQTVPGTYWCSSRYVVGGKPLRFCLPEDTRDPLFPVLGKKRFYRLDDATLRLTVTALDDDLEPETVFYTCIP